MSEKHTPEALRLAEWLDRYPRPWPEFDEAAAMLRTQHALLEQAREALIECEWEGTFRDRWGDIWPTCPVCGRNQHEGAGRAVGHADDCALHKSLAALNQHLDQK